MSGAKLVIIPEKSKLSDAFLPLRLPEILHDEADGQGREEFGVAGLVDGGEGFGERLTAANPGVQAVQGHMGRGVGEVEQGQLRLGVTADGEFFLVHNYMVFDVLLYGLRCVSIWFTGAKYVICDV